METIDLSRDGRRSRLERNAPDYLATALANIRRLYPHMSILSMGGPGPVRAHRERHPAFFGSFDWHSCVEMVWVAVRLIRLLPGLPGETGARDTLAETLSADNMVGEYATFSEAGYQSLERPYGWGWYLTLAAEIASWDDRQAAIWSTRLAPLAELFAGRLLAWLPLLAYPQRTGMHANTAFGLNRSWDWAGCHSPPLVEEMTQTARRLFSADTEYPAHYEPSGADFLSGALTEAELMGRVLDAGEWAEWLHDFLPGLADARPRELFEPATGAATSDGQLAHLVGLNLSRAAGFLWLADRLGEDDRRHRALTAAASRHAASSLGAAVDSDYMVEHWLAAYALLLLT